MFSRIALALLLCSLASSLAFQEENRVLTLTTSDFDQAISSSKYVLVEFYAPWCGHCKRLAPEYEEAALALEEKGSKVRLAKVDATVETELAEKYDIGSFPTIILFEDGKASPYTGGRTAPMIFGWIKRKTENPSGYLDSATNIDKFVEKNDLLILFYGDELETAFRMYKTIAAKHMDLPFFHTTAADIYQKYNPSREAKISIIRSFDPAIVNFDDVYTEANIEAFILNNQHPKVLPYNNNKHAKLIFGDRNPVIFLITGRGDSSARALKAVQSAADKLYNKIFVSTCNIDDELCQKVAKYLGLNKEDIPTLALIRPPKGQHPGLKFILEKKISEENILGLFEDYTNEKLVTLPKSEEVPTSNSDHLKVIVGRTFNDIALDNYKDVLVFFTDFECADCKEILAVIQGLAKLVVPIQDLLVGKFDLTSNEVRGVNFTTGPQILFYPRNQKNDPIVYTGEKNIKAIYQFLTERLTVEHDLSKINVDAVLQDIEREVENKAKAAELSRQKLLELEAQNKARQAAQAQADADAQARAQTIKSSISQDL